MKNNPPSKPKDERSEPESTKRHVYVEPGVKIDLVTDLKEKYETAQSDSTTHSNKVLFWTKISAALLLVYAGLSAWQALSAHRTLQAIKEQFRLDQRPYVAVMKFQIMDRIVPGGQPKQHQVFEIEQPLVVNINYKNVGKSPAINTVFHYHILFGDNLRYNFKIEPTDKGKDGDTVAPGSEIDVTTVSLHNTYSRETADLHLADVINWDGSQPIMVFGRVSYWDTSGAFYCTPYMARYIPENWAFITDMTIDGTKYLATDLCPDKQ